MSVSALFQELGIALLLGMLVGLQRERSDARLAGIRTFPLVTLLGALCGLLAQSVGGWVVAAGILALAGLIVTGKMIEIRGGAFEPGMTSEVAILLMFAVGAYLVFGYRLVAVAIGGAAAVLLHFKVQMHGAVSRLADDDVKAIMQFVLLALVILPVLPDRTFGPYDVLNPHRIWWMVVLIVGISLGGYIAFKFFGQRAGMLLGGILGGVVSSTATTVSQARRSREVPEASGVAAVVITIASAVVYARLLLLVAVVAPGSLAKAAPPLVTLLLFMVLLASALWLWNRKAIFSVPVHGNPSELKAAMVFGLLYALVLFGVAAAREHFGDRGLFVVAGISGLTDVDAIALSALQLGKTGRVDGAVIWKLIVLASLSNLVFKGGAVALLGHPRLRLQIAVLFGIAIAAGLLLLGVWPA